MWKRYAEETANIKPLTPEERAEIDRENEMFKKRAQEQEEARKRRDEEYKERAEQGRRRAYRDVCLPYYLTGERRVAAIQKLMAGEIPQWLRE